ncbi:hypothetical protein [Pseudorhodoferax sp. Leaf267]|uniref:hypothetical protein n=1 Tax=Pseudorhodoferax sp. Leaf267 TaxID=1736316 RepID=UPI0006FA2479|nr:hypothetical protein [Pseudorhodoferax sp. Leaf267]KQP19763.1 hypothetical protein ASF43_28430 [Pseudorhodoferax sp. Leaf267]
MAEYRVTALRYVNQELIAVLMGQAAGSGGDWTQEPQEARVPEVVARIEAGDTVRALLRDGSQVDVGPALKVVTDEQGHKTLALDNAPSDCLELSDLERF